MLFRAYALFAPAGPVGERRGHHATNIRCAGSRASCGRRSGAGHNTRADGSWKLKLACVWGGELVSVLTSSILQMGFIWHITLTTNSASMLSLASLMGFLPLALLGSVAGAIVDRLPLKRVLIGADLFIAAVSAFVVLASMAGSLPVWMVIVALFFRAIGSAFHTPAFQALTPLVAPPEHLTRLAGVTQLVQSGGYILGTAAAAAIYPVWGLPRWSRLTLPVRCSRARPFSPRG